LNVDADDRSLKRHTTLKRFGYQVLVEMKAGEQHTLVSASRLRASPANTAYSTTLMATFSRILLVVGGNAALKTTHLAVT